MTIVDYVFTYALQREHVEEQAWRKAEYEVGYKQLRLQWSFMPQQ